MQQIIETYGAFAKMTDIDEAVSSVQHRIVFSQLCLGGNSISIGNVYSPIIEFDRNGARAHYHRPKLGILT
jgi:hypothetical protein